MSSQDRQLDYHLSLKAFDASARAGSFAGGGRELGLSRDQVSKLVVSLERRLGQRLFDRSTRAVALTEAGAGYLERVRRGLEELAAAEEALQASDTKPVGLLRVNAPLSWGVAVLSPLCRDFRTAFPDVHIDLELSDRLSDTLPAGADVVVRIASRLEDTAAIERIGKVARGLYAAPSYLSGRTPPRQPDELKQHECVHYAHLASGSDWVLESGSEVRRVGIRAAFACNAGLAVRSSLLASGGIGILPDFLADDPVAAGELIRVLPDWSPPTLHIHALTQPAMRHAPKVRAYVDFLKSRLNEG